MKAKYLSESSFLERAKTLDHHIIFSLSWSHGLGNWNQLLEGSFLVITNRSGIWRSLIWLRWCLGYFQYSKKPIRRICPYEILYISHKLKRMRLILAIFKKSCFNNFNFLDVSLYDFAFGINWPLFERVFLYQFLLFRICHWNRDENDWNSCNLRSINISDSHQFLNYNISRTDYIIDFFSLIPDYSIHFWIS